MRRSIWRTAIAVTLLLCLGGCQSPDVSESDTVVTTPDAIEPEHTPIKENGYYQNPILSAQTPNAWAHYGFGDPFVMRYNGRYYLYVSTKDGEVGVQCWTSDNLIEWRYAGLCATDERTRGAYAPEVYYYNGYFYMYTSPAGNGHYVLRSSSPTEGFEVVTGNMGMSIDGSVFIDNNGKWYFYSANHGEMMVYDMRSPTDMRNGRTLSSISVSGAWTEGPMTVYHDGYYYVTYTGNHVLSRSYRINYGVSATSPVHFSEIDAQNPLLIHTLGTLNGIGHSSTVKGPDLDSYYIVYHSLVNPTPRRNTHVDRIIFNGTEMHIAGPVQGVQPMPEMPDVYHRFGPGESLEGWALEGSFGSVGTGLPLSDGARLTSEHVIEGDFTAEYNVTFIQKGAQAGVLFAYADAGNFGACWIDPEAQVMHIEITTGCETMTVQVPLIKSFNQKVRFDCLQSLQIERSGNTYTFYLNDRELHSMQIDSLGAGAIGYAVRGGQASFGFIGGTAAVGGRGAADTYHAIGKTGGLIPALHYAQGVFETEQIEGVHAVVASAESTLPYYVYANESGGYDLTLRYAAPSGAKVEICVDGGAVAILELPGTDALGSAICRNLPMQEGEHKIELKVTQGILKAVSLELKSGRETYAQTVSFDAQDTSFAYSDGAWIADGTLRTASRTFAKRLWGDENLGDYAVEVKITPQSDVNCGLLVRASNPGAPNFAHQIATEQDAQTGTDWLQGYFVGLTAQGVVLGKQNYGYRQLAFAPKSFDVGTLYTLRAECVGATVRVFVDGELYIEYTDPQPFMQGMFGVRVHRCAATFEQLKIESAE